MDIGSGCKELDKTISYMRTTVTRPVREFLYGQSAKEKIRLGLLCIQQGKKRPAYTNLLIYWINGNTVILVQISECYR